MKSLGYIYGQTKKKKNRKSVSDYINKRISFVPKGPYSSMRNCLERVEVVTPSLLFPDKNHLSTTYRVKL